MTHHLLELLMGDGSTCGFLIIFAFLLGAGTQVLPQRGQLAKMLELLVDLHRHNTPEDTEDKT